MKWMIQYKTLAKYILARKVATPSRNDILVLLWWIRLLWIKHIFPSTCLRRDFQFFIFSNFLPNYLIETRVVLINFDPIWNSTELKLNIEFDYACYIAKTLYCNFVLLKNIFYLILFYVIMDSIQCHWFDSHKVCAFSISIHILPLLDWKNQTLLQELDKE